LGKTKGTSDFLEAIDIQPGVTFRWLPETKWKTLSIDVFCKVPSARERITALALVARLARRGTAKFPTLRELSCALESMYGAGMGADAAKIGPVQVLRFGIDLPSPLYLGRETAGPLEDLTLRKAMSFIWDVAVRPYLAGDGYPRDRFLTEREEHKRSVMAIINDRPRYATVRLMEELSRGDPRGLPAWGVLEDVDSVSPESAWQTWRETLSRCPISVYAVGEGAQELGEILSKAKLDFPWGRDKEIWDLRKEIDSPSLPEKVLHIEDEIEGAETVLCMAFYTGIRESDPDLPALLVYDGILGGFPHSKIFMSIREKESLAYFADTTPNTWRGLVVAVAGVMDENRKRVEDLILKEVDATKRGEIRDEEIENTKKSLVRRLLSESDSQSAIARRVLTWEILGGPLTGEELVEKILKVTKDDVIKVAEKVELKAVYELRAKGESRGG